MLENILGREIVAKVTDFNDKYIFAQVDGLTFRMVRDELLKAPKINSSLKGFAYINDNHQLQLTKKVPKVQVDRYAWGTVVSSRKDLGVFVDIGLPNKDIVVSVDDLPELPQLWPQKGDKLMIGLSIDAKDRMWGKLATPEMFQTISGMAKKNMQNKNVTATVYRLKLVGTFVITDDYYLGFIHPSEREVEPRLGEVVKARVIGVKDDGTLNLSTRPRAYEAISDDSQMILMALQHTSAKQLPFTDKSSPDEIKAYFGISKGQFKRAVGHLMKAGLVKQADGFLILNEN
ncbi:CvfB family protein [Ligilactobacillus salivarius]|uniref:CvfB family protein n=1 Tax=Ligilactobacillus salivarius TaxID=1624 RepID=UPI0011CBAA22|nr:S1-like domain-containing RNA-binding protein [Ligilactobacillus salivarius]MBX0283233.1 DNA-binding protein [Ligilactobacillus salivarius]TXJ84675.1 DNA-binding protein [Ligilactobacillus salivarius]